MKKALLIIFLFVVLCVPAYADGFEIKGEDIYNDAANNIVSGKLDLNPVNLINNFFGELYSEITNTKALAKSLLLICIASAILRILPDSFGDGDISRAASFCCFVLISIQCLEIFSQGVGYGAGVIHTICEFITKFEPIFMGLLVTSGAVAQAGAFQPVLSASIYLLSVFVDKAILPMVYLSAGLGIVNSIGSFVEIGTLKKLIDSVSKWTLAAVLTLFSAILSIYGFGTSALGGVATKGLKFAVGSFVPVVGGILADTVDTVLAGTNLLKNAVGTAGMIAVISVSAVPIIKIWIMMMLLKFTAAFCEPFSDKRTTGVLIAVSDALATVFSMVITAAALFVISIGIMLIFTGVSR